jgi:glucose dehydrogenase
MTSLSILFIGIPKKVSWIVEACPLFQSLARFADSWLGAAFQFAHPGLVAAINALLSGRADLCAQEVDVQTQHNDNSRTGANLRETHLTPDNVNDAQFGMLLKRVLDDQLYTQPLVATGVQVGGSLRDLVYVTTVNNSAYAFDANDSEAVSPVWHVNFGIPANVHRTDFGCLDINGQLRDKAKVYKFAGISSSNVIRMEN